MAIKTPEIRLITVTRLLKLRGYNFETAVMELFCFHHNFSQLLLMFCWYGKWPNLVTLQMKGLKWHNGWECWVWLILRSTIYNWSYINFPIIKLDLPPSLSAPCEWFGSDWFTLNLRNQTLKSNLFLAVRHNKKFWPVLFTSGYSLVLRK